MTSALVVGGTGFVGRHAVEELIDHDYEVTVLSRGNRDRPSRDGDRVEYLTGDRGDEDALAAVARRVDPEVVVDCALFDPADARTATRVFADVDAYVYVSSGGVYDRHDIPKREDETPLHEYDPDRHADDSMASYGPRKAECDRIVARAADRGVRALVVRPTMVYGPKTTGRVDAPVSGPTSWADVPGLQTHHDYWIDRVARYDRVVVPGDGTAIWHRAYVEDVAGAIRTVAERGEPGEAYNVGDRQVFTMEDVIDLVAETLGESVEVVHASRRELDRVGLDPDDFVLYHHLGSQYPHVLSTCKLSALGWRSTPPTTAMERTVAESLESGRDGSAFDPGREAEERLLADLAG